MEARVPGAGNAAFGDVTFHQGRVPTTGETMAPGPGAERESAARGSHADGEDHQRGLHRDQMRAAAVLRGCCSFGPSEYARHTSRFACSFYREERCSAKNGLAGVLGTVCLRLSLRRF